MACTSETNSPTQIAHPPQSRPAIFTILRNFRSSDESGKVVYNRKDKSLEELSKRFLKLFVDTQNSLISLDHITHQLGKLS
jgi:hypothetical protein